MVDARVASGIFDEVTAMEARRRLGGKDGKGGEGFGRVGWAIWRFMLQELPLQTTSTHHATSDENHVNSHGRISNGDEASARIRRYLQDSARNTHIDKVLDRKGPWTQEEYQGASIVSSITHPPE